jgi:hypothetical protein
MKRPVIFLQLAVIVISLFFSTNITAQEEEKSSPFKVGLDLYSNYIWRGSKFGTGPALQPKVELSKGGFTLGSWGSFCVTDAEAAEADLYMAYAFDFGLSLGISDYYFPGTEYFDYSDSTGSHGFELNFGYAISGLSLKGNYMLNEAGSAGTAGGDMYFELGYAFKNCSLFVGGGDGWHTSDGEFSVCNIGLSTSKTIKVTDNFSIPVNGSVILNPEKEQFFVVVGISL